MLSIFLVQVIGIDHVFENRIMKTFHSIQKNEKDAHLITRTGDHR